MTSGQQQVPLRTTNENVGVEPNAVATPFLRACNILQSTMICIIPAPASTEADNIL